MKNILLLASLLAAGVSAPAFAALAAPSRNVSTILSVLSVLDSDHNGTLSDEEIAAAPVALNALDLNDDGVISPGEWRATRADGRPVRAGRGAISYNVALTLDANGDGDIQTMEIANAVSSLKRLDLNGDGKLTPDELRPLMLAHHRA